MANDKPAFWKLIVSLIIDAIGCLSYMIPGLAELSDGIWAPISAILIYILYGDIAGAIVGGLEEASPGFDFIPTATLVWIYGYVNP